MPKISIITVNKDNAIGLKKTIDSIVNQIYTDYEWIVIDAASKDGSVDLIQQYEHHISYWVSEPDGGIYAGMNKGKFCLFECINAMCVLPRRLRRF